MHIAYCCVVSNRQLCCIISRNFWSRGCFVKNEITNSIMYFSCLLKLVVCLYCASVPWFCACCSLAVLKCSACSSSLSNLCTGCAGWWTRSYGCHNDIDKNWKIWCPILPHDFRGRIWSDQGSFWTNQQHNLPSWWKRVTFEFAYELF